MNRRPIPWLVVGVVAALVAAGALAAVLLAGGGDDKGSPDTAARLVPPRAQLYLHANVDERSGQWHAGQALVRRLPSLRRLLDRAVARLGTGASAVELETRVRPWIGDEAALALLPAGRRATSLILLKVADRPGAVAFLDSLGRSRTGRYRGTEIRLFGSLEAAFIGDYLAIGSLANVKEAIVADDGDSLAADSTFRKAVGRLDTGSALAYAYAPGEGARRLLAAQRGAPARLVRVLAQPGLAAAAVTAVPEQDGLRLFYSGLLEPGAQLSTEPSNFDVALPDQLPRDTIAYVGTQGVANVLRLAARLAGQGGQGLGPVLGPLLRSLGPSGQRQLIAALQPLDEKESAIVVLPPVAAPSISIVVSNTSQSEGGDVLSGVQPLISKLLASSAKGGQVPTVAPVQVQGGEALSLRLSPSLELTYATLGGRLIVTSGGARAVNRLTASQGSLLDNQAFAPGMRDLLGEASSVLFLDLARLSALVEQTGSLQAPELRALRADLQRIGAVSVVTQSQASSQSAEIFVGVP